MIDTISIEINAGKRLQKKNFKCIRHIKTKEQESWDNIPKSQTEIGIAWPEDIKATKAYLPDVRYMDYPNPNPKVAGRYYVYRITVSIPKLMYGNNILEVSEAQFDEVVRLLYSELVFLALPTDISEEAIRSAKVIRVDFGKNVILPSSVSMRQLGDVLARSEHRLNSKYAQVQYRNGDLYREHIKERATIVYDKLAEFNANITYTRGSVDKLMVAAKKAKLFQMIRVETQIETTRQLKAELRSLKLDNRKTTFSDVFKESLAKQILSKYWGNITKNLSEKPLETKNPLTIFANAATELGCGPQKAYAKVGFVHLVDSVGLDIAKKTYCNYYDSGSWARCKNDLYSEDKGIAILPTIDTITQSISNMDLIGVWKEGEDVRF